MSFRFALITDVHFGPEAYFEGRLRKLSHHAVRLTEDFVRRVRHDEKPDLVVNLGDVIEDESAEADLARYREFTQILAGQPSPVCHVLGNHDAVHLSDDAVRGLWRREGTLHYAFDGGDLRFVVLRTVERKDRDVTVPEEQLAWLAEELERARAPVVVLVHHPASEMRLDGNRWFEKAPHVCRIGNRRALREILERSGKVVAVFNGHAHWNHLDVIAGIPYVTLQSLVENLDEDAPGRPARASAIVDWDGHRLLVRVTGEEPARYQLHPGAAQPSSGLTPGRSP